MFKDILRWTTIAGVFAVPVVIPFIVSSSMFFPYITGKNFAFRIIVELVLASWVLLALFDARYRPRFSWMLASLLFFVAVIGIADFTGENVFKSFWSNFERMEGYLAILHLFAYFVVAGTVLNTEKIWNAFWYSTLGTSVLIAIIGLKPVFAKFPELVLNGRIDASFGNPIYLAVYALFHAFIAFILMERWKGNVLHRALLGFVGFLHIAIIALTQTRGTALGFMGGVLIATFLIALFEKERKKLRLASVGVLLATIALIVTGFTIKDTEFGRTTPLVSRFTQIELSSGTVNARFMNWGMAWQGVKEKPILGWGQGNYEYVFAKYFDPGMYGEEPWFDRTHNIFFDWLVAAGFLGLIAYLLIPTSLLVHLWVFDPKETKWSLKQLFTFEAVKSLFTKRDHAFTATERALWTGLISAYMFHNLFVFDNILSYILFFSVLAYLHFRVTEGNTPLWSEAEVSKDTITTAILPMVLVVTGVIVWYVNIPGIQTSQEIILALQSNRQLPSGQVVQQTPEDILEHYKTATEIDQLGRQEVREQLAQRAATMYRSEAVSQETKREFQDFALTEVEKEVNRNPKSPRLKLFVASLYGGFGQIEKAEQTLRDVVALSPTKQVAIFQLAEVLRIQQKDEEAVELLKKAYELEPKYDEAARRYALALIRTGRDKEAVDLLTEKYGTPAIDDNSLFMEWANAKRFDIVATILESRIENNPDDVQLKVSLAAAYKELGEVDKAVQVLEKVKEKDPDYTEQMDGFIKEIRGW